MSTWHCFYFAKIKFETIISGCTYNLRTRGVKTIAQFKKDLRFITNKKFKILEFTLYTYYHKIGEKDGQH